MIICLFEWIKITRTYGTYCQVFGHSKNLSICHDTSIGQCQLLKLHVQKEKKRIGFVIDARGLVRHRCSVHFLQVFYL